MPVKILVPISGGKDSQACLKLALQTHPIEQVRGLFCDTQFEHPVTYAHVDRLRTLYGPLQIDAITSGSVLEKCQKYRRFPGGGSRHCTDELKIRPTKRYCKTLAEEQGEGFEVWYGMRTRESTERKNRYAGKVCDELYQPHEIMPGKYPKYLAKLGVMFRLPILEWDVADVFYFLDREENPLYQMGFDRVGCFPCLASGDAWKEKAFAFDTFGAEQKAKVIKLSREIGKSVWTSKGGLARNEPPCSICAE